MHPLYKTSESLLPERIWKKKKTKLIVLRHMINIRNYDKNNAYTIMSLYIQYNTIYNFIIIMITGRYHNSNMTADMLPPIIINTKIIKRL